MSRDGNRWQHYATPAEFIAAVRQERAEQWATNLAFLRWEIEGAAQTSRRQP